MRASQLLRIKLIFCFQQHPGFIMTSYLLSLCVSVRIASKLLSAQTERQDFKRQASLLWVSVLEGTRCSAALSSLPGLVLPCYRCALQPHLPQLLLETREKPKSRCPNRKEGISTQNRGEILHREHISRHQAANSRNRNTKLECRRALCSEAPTPGVCGVNRVPPAPGEVR